MRRAIGLALLSLLLLSMQWQGHVHPVEHFARVAQHQQDTVLSTPQANADCVECALLAGGFNAVHAQAAPVLPVGAVAEVACRQLQARAVDRPAWYRSRAPPVLV
jgi:hypothetical protein